MKEQYQQTISPELKKDFSLSNPMTIPQLKSVVINIGVGDSDKKMIKLAFDDLEKISGQRPVVTLARKSVAGFKIREGWPLGVKVTLRGDNMYHFLEKLIYLALPRVRDFRGISRKAFDGNGNYTLGLTEQLVFPELNPDRFTRPQGMNITIVTSAKTNDEARDLLELFGMPFRQAPTKTDAA